MNTDQDKNRGSLNRIKVHVLFASFRFDPRNTKTSQASQLSLFLSGLPLVASGRGIEDGWDIHPDFEGGDGCQCEETLPKQYIHAYGWRWETDGEYKERLETNLFYEQRSYDTWLSQSLRFHDVNGGTTAHTVKVNALKSVIGGIGK